MPSHQFETLLQTFEQSASDPVASLEERIGVYRRNCANCATVDGVAPVLAASTSVTPVLAGAVPSEWVMADGADPNLRLLFVHGGSFIAGSPADHRQMTEALSRETGAAVLVPDYRLAPENPFPAALNDCLAAWSWMLDHGRAGAAKSRAILLSGASAGGGLALALMLRLRDEAEILPDAASVFSPAADLTTSGPSMTERAHLDPTIKKEDYAWAAGIYVRDGTALTHPYVSPVFGDYSGLPPLMVFVGEREVMHDEAQRVVDKARQAGVDAHFKLQPGMVHNIEF